jgi:hypothetical protein
LNVLLIAALHPVQANRPEAVYFVYHPRNFVMDKFLQVPAWDVLMFIGFFMCLEVGRRLGCLRIKRGLNPAGSDGNVLDSAVFALYGLLLAFTFSDAATRFDQRRDLIIQEANAIRSAYAYVDMMPAPRQLELRALFQQYVQARLNAASGTLEGAAQTVANARVQELQNSIWKKASQGMTDPANATTAQVFMPTLQGMLDIATQRLAASQIHSALTVYLVLLGMSFVVAVLAGYNMALEQSIHIFRMIAFAAVMAASIYLIIDLDYPRHGLIRVNAEDQFLVAVLHHMQVSS